MRISKLYLINLSTVNIINSKLSLRATEEKKDDLGLWCVQGRFDKENRILSEILIEELAEVQPDQEARITALAL